MNYGGDGIIENSINKGNISGNEYVGGITGRNTGSQLSTIQNCINEGMVQGTEYIGGIAGDGWIVTLCKNIGNVKGNINVGGICGATRTEASITQCINEASVTGESSIGGVAGCIKEGFSGNIKASSNNGTIKITDANYSEDGYGYAGGIVGRIYGATNTATISNNYNIGKILINVVNATNVGGVLGNSVDTLKFSNNYFLQGIIQVGAIQYGEERSESEMKSAAMVTLLNTGLDTALWEIRSGENGGYPILVNVK